MLALAALASCAVVGVARAQDGGAPRADGGVSSGEGCPADAVGCHDDRLSWLHRDSAFDTIDYDSGWVPSSGRIQLRFGVHVGGSTEVAMSADASASWPLPISIAVPGTPDTGRLQIDYGLEITARLRFDVSVAGIRYHWEGDIPIPFFPEDLRMADEASFDPMLLAGTRDMRPANVSDTTDRFVLVRYDAIGGFISLPGIGGGLAADTQIRLDASYQTDRVVVSGAAEPIETENGIVVVHPAGGATDFGAAVDAAIHPEGTLTYDGFITIWPNLYLSIAGVRFHYDIAEIVLHVLDNSVDVVFDDSTLHVPLPDIEITPELDVGETNVGDTISRALDITNAGEAELVVDARMPRTPFAVPMPHLVVPPGATGSLVVELSPEMLAETRGTLALETNDPDEPLVLVHLLGAGIEGVKHDDPTTPGAGATTDGGCGCRATGAARHSIGAPLPFIASIALGLACFSAGRRRRRRSAAAPRE